jgi:beta-phosphoglucomutase-like phosphatase (HAD superfamily)
MPHHLDPWRPKISAGSYVSLLEGPVLQTHGRERLLQESRRRKLAYGIASSGRRPKIDRSREVLGVDDDVVVVERGDVPHAKPEPELFIGGRERLGFAQQFSHGPTPARDGRG